MRDSSKKSSYYFDILVAFHYINEAKFYSYCDRFTDKFMRQSIAKRIELLRSEIKHSLDEALENK